MKFSYGAGMIVILMICAIVSFSPAASDSPKHGDKEQIIDLGPFKFKAPYGEEWSSDIKPESGEAQFKKQKKSFFGGSLPVTLIHVSYNSLEKEDMWKLTEKEIADDYRNGEKANMFIQGVLPGAYRLQDVREDSVNLNGKTIYTFSYKQMGGRSFGDDKLAESILYLYFPEKFKISHSFYRILISQLSKKDKIVLLDPSPAIEIIKSIQVK